MSDRVSFTIDGVKVEAFRSQSVMDAAMEAGSTSPVSVTYRVSIPGAAAVCAR